jgi:hypothetical protein
MGLNSAHWILATSRILDVIFFFLLFFPSIFIFVFCFVLLFPSFIDPNSQQEIIEDYLLLVANPPPFSNDPRDIALHLKTLCEKRAEVASPLTLSWVLSLSQPTFSQATLSQPSFSQESTSSPISSTSTAPYPPQSSDNQPEPKVRIESENKKDWIGLDWIGLDWIGLDWIFRFQFFYFNFFCKTISLKLIFFSETLCCLYGGLYKILSLFFFS